MADAAAGAPEMPEPDFYISDTRGDIPCYNQQTVVTHGQAMAEHARSGAAKQLAAYAMLVKSMEARLTAAAKLRDAHAEAVRTLQSERDANAILTAENAELIQRAEHARRVVMEGYRRILSATDSEMRDGDLAREIAEQALAAAQTQGGT